MDGRKAGVFESQGCSKVRGVRKSGVFEPSVVGLSNLVDSRVTLDLDPFRVGRLEIIRRNKPAYPSPICEWDLEQIVKRS